MVDLLGKDTWATIFSLIYPADLLSVTLTCTSWSVICRNNPLIKEAVSRRATLSHYSFTDEKKSALRETKTISACNKKSGNLFLQKSYNTPHGVYWEATIPNSGKRLVYDGEAGRCSNFELTFDEQSLYYNSSSHGTVTLKIQNSTEGDKVIIAGCHGFRDEPTTAADVQFGVEFVNSLLRSVGLPEGFESWKSFAKQMRIDAYLYVVFFPNLVGKTWMNDNEIYQWLEGGAPNQWQKVE